MGDAYAVVGSANGGNNAEFDRPSGAADQYFTYDGTGGVAVGVLLAPAALRHLLPRDELPALQRLQRQLQAALRARPARAACRRWRPFLTLDERPVSGRGRRAHPVDPRRLHDRVDLPVLAEDRLADRRSPTRPRPTRTFPQAQQDVNYLRNSVKATVDAYTGTGDAVLVRRQRPGPQGLEQGLRRQAHQAAFGHPPELVDHLRYPEDQFKVQRDLLSRFHVTTPNGFFSGQDFWQVPKDPGQRHAGPAAVLPGGAVPRAGQRAVPADRRRGTAGAAVTSPR